MPDETLDPGQWDGVDQQTRRLVEMFIDIAQANRTRNNPPPAERAVFRKLHGVAHGRLERLPDLPFDRQVGILAHDQLDAWVRFSSDARPSDSDLGSTLGIGIKLFGVPRGNALGEQGQTADLILQNASRFFVDNAKEMADFTYAGVVQKNYDKYLAAHPKTREILDSMTVPRGSVLTSTY